MSKAKVVAIQKQIDALDVELKADNTKVQSPEIVKRIQEIKDELVKLHDELEA